MTDDTSLMEDALAPLFQAKYDWNILTDPGYDTIIGVDPVKVLAWGSHGEGRWHFTEEKKRA